MISSFSQADIPRSALVNNSACSAKLCRRARCAILRPIKASLVCIAIESVQAKLAERVGYVALAEVIRSTQGHLTSIPTNISFVTIVTLALTG